MKRFLVKTSSQNKRQIRRIQKIERLHFKKIETKGIENAEEIVEDFNLSAKELFLKDYKDLLISSQK